MLGLDVVCIRKFEVAILSTPQIIDVILHRDEKLQSTSVQFIAGRFAAKEALIKSDIGIKSFRESSDIKISSNDGGVLQTKWNDRTVNVALSITHDCDYAAAVVLRI